MIIPNQIIYNNIEYNDAKYLTNICLDIKYCWT